MSVFEDAVESARVYFCDHDIDAKLVRKKTKIKRVVMVRNWVMAYMRARDAQRFSYPMIARIIGFSDHTTVINGVRNAHREYGEVLFRRLNLMRLQSQHNPMHIPQAVHIAVRLDEIIARGERLMQAELACHFVNGEGWRVSA